MSSPVLNVTITSDSAGVKKGTDSAVSSFKGMEGAAIGAIAGIAAKVTELGLQLAMDIAGGVADAVLAVNESQSMIESRLGVTGEEAERLGKIAGDVWASGWGESTTDVTEGLIEVERQLGITNDADLSDLTGQFFALRDVMGLEVPESARLMGEVVGEGLFADGQEALDAYVTALQGVPLGMEEAFADTVDEYGPYLADLGLTGEEAFALLADAAKGGEIQLDKTGDALKEFGIRATDMSSTSVEAYEELGLNAEEMSNAILSGGDDASTAFGKIVDGLLAIDDPATRANTAIALFGTPLEDLGVNGIPTFLASLQTGTQGLGDFAGAAADMAADSTTWQDQLEAFKRQGLQALAEFVINTAIPAVQELVTWFEENWPKIEEAVRPVMEDILAIITDITTAIQTIWENWGEEITEFVTNRFKTIFAVIDGIMTAIRGVIQTVTSLIKGDWSGAWEGIKTTFSGVWQAIVALVTGFITEVKLILSNAWAAVKSVASTAWTELKNTINNGITEIVSAVTGMPGKLLALATSFLNAGKSLGSSIINGIINGIANAGEVVGNVATAVGNAVKTAAKAAANSIIDRINSALEFKVEGPGFLPDISVNPPNIPHLAAGGIVPATPGGTLARIGEGRYAEAVLPLSPQVLNALGNGGGNTTVNINAANGWSTQDYLRAQRRNGLRNAA